MHFKLDGRAPHPHMHFKLDGRELCTSTEWKLRKRRCGYLRGWRTNLYPNVVRPEDQFLEDLPENTVDDGSLLAHATVMNLGVTGTWGDESTIKMCAPAIVISKPVVLRTRAHRTHRLIRSMSRALVVNIATYLMPNWVRTTLR